MKLLIVLLIATSYLGFETTTYNTERSLGLILETPFDSVLELLVTTEHVKEDMPDNFDLRTESNNCIGEVRDQGKCGSCWAFAVSEVMTDRTCIKTEGKRRPVFSPQQLVDCDMLDHGCQGGNLLFPWLYYWVVGAAEESCYGNYVSGETKKRQFCLVTKFSCKHTRISIGTIKISKDVNTIKSDLMRHGPVVAGFMVHESFMKYRSGIYEETSDKGSLLGGHAVKIVGWGTENGKGYWIVQNSWNTTWGEQGFFRIAHGSFGMENMIINAVPNV